MSNIREQRKEIFQNTMEMCQKEEKLKKAIEEAKRRQKVILETDCVLVQKIAPKFDIPAKVSISMKRCLEAAGEYTGQKICVLNFASATNPGGGVQKGANAQEESICRCSTLYPCISDDKIKEKFHNKHRELLRAGKMDSLYNCDCIYTPDVVVFKTDTDHPGQMEQRDWYQIDMLSCAAPNLRKNPSNAMNPDSGDKAPAIKPDELLKLHKKRIQRILDIAMGQGAEVVILGAFGCGAFQNPPEIVAKAMNQVVKDYLYRFKSIEFAVYCPPNQTRNYDIFCHELALASEN